MLRRLCSPVPLKPEHCLCQATAASTKAQPEGSVTPGGAAVLVDRGVCTGAAALSGAGAPPEAPGWRRPEPRQRSGLQASFLEWPTCGLSVQSGPRGKEFLTGQCTSARGAALTRV